MREDSARGALHDQAHCYAIGVDHGFGNVRLKIRESAQKHAHPFDETIRSVRLGENDLVVVDDVAGDVLRQTVELALIEDSVDEANNN